MYTVGQIFENIYPADCANWCNDNNCHIQQINDDSNIRRFQIQQKTNTQTNPVIDPVQLAQSLIQYVKPATNETLGLVKPDNETLTITDGILSVINNDTSSSGDWEFILNTQGYARNKTTGFTIYWNTLTPAFTSGSSMTYVTYTFCIPFKTILTYSNERFSEYSGGISTITNTTVTYSGVSISGIDCTHRLLIIGIT